MSSNKNKPRPRKTDQVDALCVGVVHSFDLIRKMLNALSIEDKATLDEMDAIQEYIVNKCARLDLPPEEIAAVKQLEEKLKEANGTVAANNVN